MSVCITPTSCLTQVASSLWNQLALSLSDAAGQMVTTLFGWWTTTAPLDVDSALVRTGQQYVTSWIALPVAVLAVLAAVGWGVLTGSFGWVTDVARGMVVFGVVAAGSLPVVSALQAWSAALARGLLAATPTGDVGRRLVTLLELPGSQPLTIAFWAAIVLIVSAVQYLLMLFRDGAVLVLAAVLPLAAAGQFNRGSVLWLPKIAGWLLAFIFVKPAAALIYFFGLSMVGQGRGVHELAVAVCLLLAAIFALPAMLRLVTFAVTPAPMSSSSLGTVATVTGLGASVAQASASRRYLSTAAPRGASAAGPAAAGAAAAASAVSAASKVPARGVTP